MLNAYGHGHGHGDDDSSSSEDNLFAATEWHDVRSQFVSRSKTSTPLQRRQSAIITNTHRDVLAPMRRHRPRLTPSGSTGSAPSSGGHRYSLSNLIKSRHSLSLSKRPSLSIRKLLPSLTGSSKRNEKRGCTPTPEPIPEHESPLHLSMSCHVVSNNLLLNEIIDEMAGNPMDEHHANYGNHGGVSMDHMVCGMDRGNDIVEEEMCDIEDVDEFEMGCTSEDTADEQRGGGHGDQGDDPLPGLDGLYGDGAVLQCVNGLNAEESVSHKVGNGHIAVNSLQIKVNLFTIILFFISLQLTVIIGIGCVPPPRTQIRCPELIVD